MFPCLQPATRQFVSVGLSACVCVCVCVNERTCPFKVQNTGIKLWDGWKGWQRPAKVQVFVPDRVNVKCPFQGSRRRESRVGERVG